MPLTRRQPSDADLVHGVLQGRTRLYGQLVDRYQGLVCATLLARLGRGGDWTELAAETFLGAYRRLDVLREPGRFGPWVRGVAEGLAAGHRRHREQVLPLHASGASSPAPGPPAQSAGAQEAAGHEPVWAALEALTLEHREIILLHQLCGRPLEEVAACLESPVEEAAVRLQRAGEALRLRLGEDAQARLVVALDRCRSGLVLRRRVMGALPLAPWRAAGFGQRLVVLTRLTWITHLAVTAAAGAVLAVWLAGWWPQGSGRPRSAVPEREGVRVRLADEDEYWRFVDRTRFTDGGDGPSLYGSPRLGFGARQRETRALRQGRGGVLTWGFGEGDEGWRALGRRAPQAEPIPLAPEVQGGVLRLALEDGTRLVELVSPEIGYRAELFDRIEVRARLLSDAPQPGSFAVSWTLPANRLLPGRFQTRAPGPVLYTSQWRTLAVGDLTAVPGEECRGSAVSAAARVPPQPLRWEGELVDVRLTLGLEDPCVEAPAPAGPGPRVLEVDAVRLSGSGRGRPLALPPPPSPPAPGHGEWLASPRVYPVQQRGLVWPWLGDLDADGDADLLVSFAEEQGSTADLRRLARGWVTLFNDGRGRFAVGDVHVLAPPGAPGGLLRLSADDLNEDGLLDVVVGAGADSTTVFANQGAGLFTPYLVWRGEWLLGTGDVDGDGRVDVATATPAEGGQPRGWVRVHLADGHGGFTTVAVGPPPDVGPSYPWALGDYDGDARAEMLCVETAAPGQGAAAIAVLSHYEAGRWTRRERVPLGVPGPAASHWSVLPPAYAGDLDGDGGWDVGLPLGLLHAGGGLRGMGMVVRAGAQADGEGVWLGRAVHLSQRLTHGASIVPQVQDLDRDGIADPLFVDVNYRRGPALLVLRGQRHAWPTEVGRYLLPGEPRGWVCGDLDGDGWADVAVVTEGPGEAGVCVLRNLASQGFLPAAADRR
ncbi:MAG: FG-GAP-like repeat-containing protein [Candidatus Latescibacterota bacterium]